MSTFKFNFSGENECKTEDAGEEVSWIISKEIVPNMQIKELDKMVSRAKMFTYDDIEIGHVVISEALSNIEESGFTNAVNLAETQHSDLVTGVYEGGLKIWECTHDLIKYLVEQKLQISLAKTKVLDLGCGVGILGIYAFINGAFVTFQDYNKEVLEHVTIPNVLLNIDEDQRDIEIQKCKFYSGDWTSFNENLPEDELYDLILTSETIYNENNYTKLIDLFIKRLNDNGMALVAAKTCYFGVGGGMRQFEQKLKNTELLQYEICWKSSGGIQREILKITRR